MIIETKVGKYEILKNEREAFVLDAFEKRYLPEYFDKYAYIVGDLADDILRLKGFSVDPKSSSYFHYIPEYITEGCSYNCKYYILKRVKGDVPQQNNNKKHYKHFNKNKKKRDEANG